MMPFVDIGRKDILGSGWDLVFQFTAPLIIWMGEIKEESAENSIRFNLHAARTPFFKTIFEFAESDGEIILPGKKLS